MVTVGVVTGAASGMGRACAERIAALVDVVVLVDRNQDALVDVATRLGAQAASARCETYPLDVTDAAGVAALTTRVADLGMLRVLVHAAGVSPVAADWRQVLTIDLGGTALVVEALSALATTGTAIVCFASIAPSLFGLNEADSDSLAVIDDPLSPEFLERIHAVRGPEIENAELAYAWAKLGVRRLVEREAMTLGRRGARICSVSPGVIDTPMMRSESEARDADTTLLDLSPFERYGRADEVAGAVAYLVSDDASFVNGIDLVVDGGLLAALRSGGARPLE